MNARDDFPELAENRGWTRYRTVDGATYLRGQERIEIYLKSDGSIQMATRYEGFDLAGTPQFSAETPSKGKKDCVLQWLMAATNHPTTV